MAGSDRPPSPGWEPASVSRQLSASASEACPICRTEGLGRSFEIPGLLALRCAACGHVVARQFPPSGAEVDYHAQYDDGAFLDALKETRQRQAAMVIAAIRRHFPRPGHLVDFGAGRGWFLEACRREGIAPLAGVDTSDLAVAGLQRAGFEAHLLPGARARRGAVLRALSFRPRVLTLLDVLEHFPPEQVATTLRDLLDDCPELELVIVKVPVRGLLYELARWLSRAGLHGPIRQLFQVGTWPPHLNYFSPRSLEELLDEVGLAVAERIGDADFEPARLADRMGARSWLLRALFHGAGAGLRLAIRVLRLDDSAIFVTRPRGSSGTLSGRVRESA